MTPPPAVTAGPTVLRQIASQSAEAAELATALLVHRQCSVPELEQVLAAPRAWLHDPVLDRLAAALMDAQLSSEGEALGARGQSLLGAPGQHPGWSSVLSVTAIARPVIAWKTRDAAREQARQRQALEQLQLQAEGALIRALEAVRASYDLELRVRRGERPEQLRHKDLSLPPVTPSSLHRPGEHLTLGWAQDARGSWLALLSSAEQPGSAEIWQGWRRVERAARRRTHAGLSPDERERLIETAQLLALGSLDSQLALHQVWAQMMPQGGGSAAQLERSWGAAHLTWEEAAGRMVTGATPQGGLQCSPGSDWEPAQSFLWACELPGRAVVLERSALEGARAGWPGLPTGLPLSTRPAATGAETARLRQSPAVEDLEGESFTAELQARLHLERPELGPTQPVPNVLSFEGWVCAAAPLGPVDRQGAPVAHPGEH